MLSLVAKIWGWGPHGGSVPSPGFYGSDTPQHFISDITLVVIGQNYFHNPGIKIG